MVFDLREKHNCVSVSYKIVFVTIDLAYNKLVLRCMETSSLKFAVLLFRIILQHFLFSFFPYFLVYLFYPLSVSLCYPKLLKGAIG